MDDSHYLTNIVPQDLDNNSGYNRIVFVLRERLVRLYTVEREIFEAHNFRSFRG